ncbi:unnamed protein product, partial [Mesorhabditis belari]|uniref:Uncharacterized protein n=1 Tax=Mesorhabditis belari TaxID=2138241 RepID=A0AAF3EYC5_9BILA
MIVPTSIVVLLLVSELYIHYQRRRKTRRQRQRGVEWADYLNVQRHILTEIASGKSSSNYKAIVTAIMTIIKKTDERVIMRCHRLKTRDEKRHSRGIGTLLIF